MHQEGSEDDLFNRITAMGHDLRHLMKENLCLRAIDSSAAFNAVFRILKLEMPLFFGRLRDTAEVLYTIELIAGFPNREPGKGNLYGHSLLVEQNLFFAKKPRQQRSECSDYYNSESG